MSLGFQIQRQAAVLLQGTDKDTVFQDIRTGEPFLTVNIHRIFLHNRENDQLVGVGGTGEHLNIALFQILIGILDHRDGMGIHQDPGRSVGRLTSCDLLPCMEYGDEVAFQRSLAEELFYIQSCRNALERCIGNGGAAVRYRWADGSTSFTRFRRTGPGQVRVSGLKLPAPVNSGAAVQNSVR